MKKPRFPAPRACQPPFLAFAFALALGSTHAPGWYMPQTGRWLNRDPIGHEGGANIYAAAENDPVNKGDALGLWTQVYRLKEPWADVCADSANDTWETLSQKVLLDPNEAPKWVRNYDGTPQQGTVYQVPNKVFADIGPAAWFWDILYPFPTTFWYLRDLAVAQGRDFARSGYWVSTVDRVSSGAVIAHLEDPAIWGYIFAGHGTDGSGLVTQDGILFPAKSRYTPFGIATMRLYACYSAQDIRFKKTGLRLWEGNVWPGGEFVGFESVGDLKPGTPVYRKGGPIMVHSQPAVSWQ